MSTVTARAATGEAVTAPPPVVAVRGNPTDAELAALLVVLSALGGAADGPRRAPSRWSHPAGLIRSVSTTRPGAWSSSWQRR